MESVLIILFGILVIILIASLRNELQKKFDILNKNFIAVHKQVKEFREQVQEKPKEARTASTWEEVPLKDNALEVSFQVPVSVTPETKIEEKPKTVIAEKVEIPKDIVKEEVKPVIVEKVIPMEEPIMADKKVAAIIAEPVIKKSAFTAEDLKSTAFHGGESILKEKKKESDFEKVIGENWLNKIGIAILVIGIGFFVKYAIDKNWIGEWGRLFIGIGTAFGMIAIAHWMRKNYHAFSSVLIGGGVATLYYTISIGYHDYHLFSQATAFAIMTVITLMASLMAIWYDRKELAIISLVGGFTAPFMVAGETHNANTFFTYIAILNAGMLLLSFFKKWIILNRLAFAFTAVYLTAWIVTNNMATPAHTNTAITFLVVFFIQFLAMNLSYNIRQKISFNAWEFIHLFSISGLFYGGMMYCLAVSQNHEFQGLFTALISVLFFVLTIVTKRIQGTDANLVHLLMGKTVTFITLTVFMQFDGHYTTLFWALEAVVLLWLAQKTNLNLLRQASVLILTIAIGALVVDWAKIYFTVQTFLPIVFNKIVATGFFVLVSFAASIYLLRKEPEENTFVGFSASQYRSLLITATVLGTYFVGLFEMIHQVDRFDSFPVASQMLWLYHFGFILVSLVVSFYRKNVLAKQVFFVCGTVALALFIFAGHHIHINLRDSLFESQALSAFYNLHFVIVGLFVTIGFALWKLSARIFEEKGMREFFTVLLSLFGLFIVTAEMDMLAVHHFANNMAEKASILRHTQIAGYTILWGIYSFALMIFGMRQKLRTIRIFSLVAFSITLIKLFAFDIRNISEGGKIAAFISLGVMLLVISFLYQKLRKIIVDGDVG